MLRFGKDAGEEEEVEEQGIAASSYGHPCYLHTSSGLNSTHSEGSLLLLLNVLSGTSSKGMHARNLTTDSSQ